MSKNKANGKKSKLKVILIIVGVVLALFIGVIIIGVVQVSRMAAEMTDAMNNFEIAEVGNIDVITEGTGIVESVNTDVISTDYQCKIETIYKGDGEEVAEGEAVALVKGDNVEDTISQLQSKLDEIDYQILYNEKYDSKTVTAPVSGIIKRVYAAKDDEVKYVMNENNALMEISADGKLKVEFQSEAQVHVGDKVKVMLGETEISGIIETVSDDNITVTFNDSVDYKVDEEVSILSSDGAEIGKGQIKSNYPVNVTANSGVISEIKISVDKKVTAGNAVITLKDVSYSQSYLSLLNQREEINNSINDATKYKTGFTITASKTGIITGLTAKTGDMIPAGTAMFSILGNDKYQVTVKIDELDIKGIEAGQEATVTLDAIEDTEYTGKVSKVSLVGQNENGVSSYNVTVLLDSSEGLLPGLSANAKIVVASKENVILIPADSIQTVDGQKIVTIIRPDGIYEDVNVTLGLVNSSKAEVIEGVNEGDQVVKIMKISDIYSELGITVEE